MSLVVVTGASGFIGSALRARLAADGARVVGIDRRPARDWCGAHLQADLLDGDAAVESVLREADAVFHLAARPGVRDADPRIEWLRHRDNVLVTERVLELVPLSTPLVVTSSSSVYGAAPDGRPSREADPLRPLGGYARSKAAAEAACARRADAGGHVALARPFTVVGEGQRPDMAVALWLDAARDGRPLKVLGGPGRSRDLTDVRDVVEGLIRMAARAVTGVVNLGTGVAHRLEDIVAAVTAAVGSPSPIVVLPVGDDEPPATRADVSRCRRVLGFVPSTDLAAVVARQSETAFAPLSEVVAEVV